ncbi:MAG: hypothetical protein AVDCRST_MAG49-1751, partial [uncultured Thermomicrobiales bacterium]
DARLAAVGGDARRGRAPGHPAAVADPGRRLRRGRPHAAGRGLRPGPPGRPVDRPVHGLPRPPPLRRVGDRGGRRHWRRRDLLRDQEGASPSPPGLPPLRPGAGDRRRRAAYHDRRGLPPARLPGRDRPPRPVRSVRGLPPGSRV